MADGMTSILSRPLEAAGVEVLDFATLLDTRPMTGVQWLAISLCALVAFLDGFDIQIASLVVPAISTDWGLAPSSFGLVLAAALIGMAFAMAAIAPLGDRFGRRPLIIAGFLVVGIGSCASAFCHSIETLIICRLFTGLGLGASLPNATALTSEFAPARYRSRILVAVYANMGLGGIVGGFITPAILEAAGWRGVFLAGGSIPFVLCVVMGLLLPESVPFMLRQAHSHRRMIPTFARMWPDIDWRTLAVQKKYGRKVRIGDVLAPLYRTSTILLWFIYTIVTFLVYLLLSWLPILLISAGWSVSEAVNGTVTLAIGGIVAGGLQGWYADKGHAIGALIASFLVSAFAFLSFAIIPPDHSIWIALIILGGVGTSGAIFAMTALSARIYPIEIRAGGIGIAAGVARLGAVAAPIAGSVIMGWRLDPNRVLAGMAAPMIVCAIVLAIFASRFRRSE